MNGWTVQNGQSMYFIGFAGMEYWFEKTDNWEAVSLAYSRRVDSAPDEIIEPKEITVPDYVMSVLDRDGISLRRRADSLSEVMA